MILKSKILPLVLGVFLTAVSLSPAKLFADNGAYPLGFSVKSKGIGGAGVAYGQDSFAGLANPAAIVDVCNSADLGILYIYHDQYSKVTNSPFNGLEDGTYPFNGSKHLVGGELGYKTVLRNGIAFALTVTPQSGGFIKQQPTQYTNPPGPEQLDKLNMKAAYLAITPCYAIKFKKKYSLGIAFDITFATINVKGLHGLATQAQAGGFEVANATVHPNHVTNRGWNFAHGGAIRVGWLGDVHPCLSIGFSYRSRTFMTRFNAYQGLLSPLGKSELPAVWAAGLALRVIPRTVIAFDFNRIEWESIKAYGNRVAYFFVSNFDPLTAFVLNPHGACPKGSAFGWKSRNVYKVGIKYCYCDSITLRAGYNYGKSPIPRRGTLSSIFLPATVEHHATLGGSWRPSPCGEWSFALIHGFRNTIKGHEYPIEPPEVEEIFKIANYTTRITSFIEQIAFQYTRYF